MDTAEILKKVRQIEIKTKGLTNHIFAGEYHSAFKGRGMSFSEVRDYHFGDDVRSIDWNVTARFNHPFVKVFEEERELTVMLLVDMSESSSFGTKKQDKRDLITELCAVLAFSAIKNNDKVGVIFFSDGMEKYIPPKKGKSHILFIIRELLSFTPKRKGTNIKETLRFFNNATKKRSIVFMLSDFLSGNYQDALNIAAKRHDVVGVQVYDQRDKDLPPVGLIQVADAETGATQWVDTNDRRVRQYYEQQFLQHSQYCKNAFMKSGAELVSVRTDEDYVKALQTFFLNRA
ncbi:Protein of unknown function DUF58 [Chitinophaga ginsengisegetis]|uniref:DUF58 domain-containing protein n=1 Tax=Chitinophaga ginsengisegetis TaxID=393003 RepID=A0A1T5NRI8_9BACT|nr:DUF58 domain-containing protein [Chitinophaga ginsengisegetis]MDR6565879.1 uncharacterized protein (DUF58 family) [Chitinophaga ginsengisegetis]MDR6645608.1 uncharacterized protein (DUF58 family) [Chitinophaga ginsengisegetis]MDR6651800.1 uncharacterized protein (DUF58 family) [Chitinophaga ginsengisegetis]SKD02967.1 Protein of unknown function DUF58 [Chitinophaga ginsengisegetis]